MDLLTHLFLPITVAYVLRPDLFPSPVYLSTAFFAVFPDVDKLFGLQGVLHSAIVLGILSGLGILVERWYRSEVRYSGLVAVLLFSHLFLDVLDGGPVTVLYPLSNVGIGLHYPTELVLGGDIESSAVRKPVPEVKVATPNRGPTTYPLVNGYGVLSGVVFLVLCLRDVWSASNA